MASTEPAMTDPREPNDYNVNPDGPDFGNLGENVADGYQHPWPDEQTRTFPQPGDFIDAEDDA